MRRRVEHRGDENAGGRGGANGRRRMKERVAVSQSEDPGALCITSSLSFPPLVAFTL